MLDGMKNYRVERQEHLRKNTTFASKGGLEFPAQKDAVVTAVYTYQPKIVTRLLPPEMGTNDVDIINSANALVALYGEKCLDSEFLTSMLAEMLPQSKIDSANIVFMSKKYTKTARFRGGEFACETVEEILKSPYQNEKQ